MTCPMYLNVVIREGAVILELGLPSLILQRRKWKGG